MTALSFRYDTVSKGKGVFKRVAESVPGSSQYYLLVNDSTGPKIQQWYTAQEVGCPDGTGTCSVTPSTSLAEGAGQWWIIWCQIREFA